MTDLFAAYSPELGEVLFSEFSVFAMGLHYFDRETREVVRLRCARVNGCDLCKSQRWVDDNGLPISQEVSAAIDAYESADLPEEQKAALRIVDAFLNNPSAAADQGFRARAYEHFDASQILSLLLDSMKWSAAKIGVALELDEPNGSAMYFDETGAQHILA
ncbi:carboxymuconolactone decarboxylase family protein [Nocardioides immobilis]|nr:carboxymuconolactone decarboxylase family protein [Nocardioides immobilis]